MHINRGLVTIQMFCPKPLGTGERGSYTFPLTTCSGNIIRFYFPSNLENTIRKFIIWRQTTYPLGKCHARSTSTELFPNSGSWMISRVYLKVCVADCCQNIIMAKLFRVVWLSNLVYKICSSWSKSENRVNSIYQINETLSEFHYVTSERDIIPLFERET